MKNIGRFGKNSVLTGKSAAGLLESAVSEGHQTSTGFSPPNSLNLFGRPVNWKSSSELSFTAGLAATGLRSAAFLEGQALVDNYQQMIAAARKHIPWVLYAASQAHNKESTSIDQDHGSYHAISDAGFFQIFASNVQEVLDLGIIAHKIAELSLIPGIIGMDGYSTAYSAQGLDIPDSDAIAKFLGDPDDQISSPTPAQEIIFGKVRRRVPNWFNFDYPTLNGAPKDNIRLGYEAASNQQFFYKHLPEIVTKVLSEYAQLSGRTYHPVTSYQAEDAQYLVLTQGGDFNKVAAMVDYFRSQKKRVGCLNLTIFRPFPIGELIDLINGIKAITVLERVSRPLAVEAPIFQELAAGYQQAGKGNLVKMHSGIHGMGGSGISYEEIGCAFENMMQDRGGKTKFYLGVDFTKDSSSFPKQEILLQNVNREYPDLKEITLSRPSSALAFQPDGVLGIHISLGSVELYFPDVAQEFVGLISFIYDQPVKGIISSYPSGYLLSLSTDSANYPAEKEGNLDCLLTSLSTLKSNPNLIDSLKPGAHLVLMLFGKETDVAVVLPKVLCDEVDNNHLSVHQVFIGDSELVVPTLQGAVVRILSKLSNDSRDDKKMLESIEDYYHKHGDEIEDQTIDSIKRGLTVLDKSIDLSAAAQEDESTLDLPYTVRQYKDQGPPFSRLSHFYNNVGYFYQTGQQKELVADPFQAISAIPASSSNFLNHAQGRQQIPLFKPSSCTACGSCFVHCPHSAIPPLAIGVEALVNGAMAIASAGGTKISQLTPVVKNLAKVTNEVIKEAAPQVNEVSDFLSLGFERLIGMMKLEGEKLDTIKRDFEEVENIISEFPVAATAPFFSQPETMEKGSGELFALSVDPMACTGCNVCIDVCEEDALEMVTQTPEILQKVGSNFKLWEQLPDTSGETVSRMVHDSEYNSFAGTLLSRNFYTSMTGGSNSESGADSKALLHLLTAGIESVIQPRFLGLTEELAKLIESLSENIHSKLSDALPREDFQRLSKVINQSAEDKMPFDDVVGLLGSEEHLKLVDTGELQRKIELVSALKDLYWVLTEGPTGSGRSRFGMVISAGEGLPWSGQYPQNVFGSPIMITLDDTTPDLAIGLFMGHLRHQLDNIKLLRRAKLEAKDKYVPEIQDAEIASLSWDKLDDKEKAVIPPIFLVGERKGLIEENWSNINSLLATGFPIKIVILDTAIQGEEIAPEEHLAIGANFFLSAIALRNAYVLQSSLGFPDHLFKGFQEGIHALGPALFYLLAPDKEKHSFEPRGWTELPALAAKTRTFPGFRFQPQGMSNYLTSSFDLSANASCDSAWVTEDLRYLEAEEEKTIPYTYTYADWAATQTALKDNFRPFEEKEGSPTPVAEYLDLAEGSRAGKVPAITKIDQEGKLHKFSVGPAIISATRAILLNWNTLREIGGILTEFPDKLRAEVEQEVNEKHDKILANLKAEYEEKLKTQESEQMEIVKKKLRDRLLALSEQNR